MKSNIVLLTEKLVRIKTDPHDKKALSDALDVALLPLKEFTIERFEKNGYKSALVYNTKKRPKRFTVLLTGHLDIIPGKEHQYTPEIKGNRLYGVGVMDMKANTASMIYAFKDVAKTVTYPLAMQLVTDEELGGFDTTKHQLDSGVRADFAIAGEATQLDIENKMKGILWAKISSQGKTAHGAYPWKGDNAIWNIYEFLKNLQGKFPEQQDDTWRTTVNVANIETPNKTFNKIPDFCEVSLDIRYVPEDSETILTTLKSLVPKGCKLEVLVKEPAVATDEKNTYVQLLKKEIEKVTKKKIAILSANGSSDVRHFTRIGDDAIEFGPVGKGMGSDNEWVDIKSLDQYYTILKSFLLTLNK